MTTVNILIFVLILVVLIILHEAGHMIVAKLSGMRVERFSVFMGRPIWSVTRGETQYAVGWLPIGGYVKITGMLREELVHREYDPQTGRVISEREEPPEVQARAYCNATTTRKVATILAGPMANVIVAILAFAIAFWIGIAQTDVGNTVRVVTDASPAQVAGLVPDDRILSINGVGPAADGDTAAMRRQLESNPNRPVELVVERGGERIAITTPPLRSDPQDPAIGRIGVQFAPRRIEDAQYGFLPGLGRAVDFTWFLTKEQVKALVRLVYDSESRRDVSSVVGIGAAYDEVSRDGLGIVFQFIGALSLILAIMNLLPLLPLDGGHIVFALAERIRGKRMDISIYQRASVVGIAIVGILFIYALNNDIGRLAGEGFQP